MISLGKVCAAAYLRVITAEFSAVRRRAVLLKPRADCTQTPRHFLRHAAVGRGTYVEKQIAASAGAKMQIAQYLLWRGHKILCLLAVNVSPSEAVECFAGFPIAFGGAYLFLGREKILVERTPVVDDDVRLKLAEPAVTVYGIPTFPILHRARNVVPQNIYFAVV